jgi:acetoin:2,6-dichlorophenolindophenol oxidoreductase subunit alpha
MKQRHVSELGELVQPGVAAYMGPCDLAGFAPTQLKQLLRTMLLIRSVEEQIVLWVEQGRARCPCHLGIGQEAIATGIAVSLRSSDRLFGNHRSHGHYLAAGGDTYALLAEVLGRADGCSRGMGGSMHLYSADHGFYGSVPIVAGTIPIAVGAALAAKLDGGDCVAVAFFGDGASEEGVMHESLNLASSYQLPVVFVCENNLYSSHLDIVLRQPSDRISRHADAHCVRAAIVDGNDVTAVARIAAELIGAARTGSGPVFLEAITYRWRGHVGPKEDLDVGVRRSMESLAAWKRRDPVRRLENALVEADLATGEELRALAGEVRAQVEEAALRALDSPWPPQTDLLDFVYARV